MTATHAERGCDALLSFMSDATTGLAARCAAINTDMGDKYKLPCAAATPSWRFPQLGDAGGWRQVPMALVVWDGDSIESRTADDSQYVNGYWVFLVIGVQHTKGDQQWESVLRMRAQRAFREMFDTTRWGGGTWNGHTLSTSSGTGRVIDAYIDSINSGPAVKVPELDNSRAVVLLARVLVRITESQSPS